MYELQQNMEAIRQDTKIQLELNSQQQNQPQNIIVHQPPCPQPIAAAPIQPAIQTKYIEVDRHTHCYDQHQHCRCAPRRCQCRPCPPPKPPPTPPPPPYIPLQLPPPPPIRVQELPPAGGRGGAAGRGGGGYSWYVEEYIPPQLVEEGKEPTEAYRIERRFGPNGEPIDGGPPLNVSGIGRGKPIGMGRGGGVPMGGGGMPMGGGGAPYYRPPTQFRPRPINGYNYYNDNSIWNEPIPGVDEGVTFDHR
ncbi:hypothetical protein SNE40_011605 [Patella caerulea]|uniref:Uncharacterized protein n=1 Tax=Patella caerulea TaxID=87958 RepID=A0AAN8PPJ1_PATCE